MAAPPYYANVVQCSEGCPIAQNCNRDLTLPRRFLPRGTTSRATPGRVRLMIVMANPGRPEASEDDVYRIRPTPQEVADAAWNFTAEILEGRAHFNTTLARVITEAAFLLSCDASAALDHCVVTNHVKCSTPESFSSYSKGSKLEQRRETSQRCVKRHLVPEIAYWRPSKIAVFSITARDALDRAGIRYDGAISHPAALGANRNALGRQQKLMQLKAQLGL